MTTAPPDAARMLCSDADLAVDDDPRGSAATFTSFLLIEHLSSFGREAAADALGLVYGDTAPTVAATPGLRPLAIRPVGRTDDTGTTVRWLGRTGPHAVLRPVTGPPTLAELTALGSAGAGAVDPLFAVCTNGSRDRCCAVKGRDLAATLHLALDDPHDDPTVVEVSHLGGHRYAPTMLVLPWGYAYAWLDRSSALDVAEAARDGLVHPTGLRGRADLPAAAQVAEAIWRTELGPAPMDAVIGIDTRADGDVQLVTALVAGRREELRLMHTPGPMIGATRCGGKPIATGRWRRV